VRLASYIAKGKESVGLVIENTLYDINEVQKALNEFIVFSEPRFLRVDTASLHMEALLALGDEGIDGCRRMHDFLLRFREDGDQCQLRHAALNCSEVRWLPPVPRPPFMYGVAGNSPFYFRDKDFQIPAYPQGFLRPCTSLIGHNEPVTIPPFYRTFRAAAELGVVIGKGGRNISPKKAMEHVLGYTIVNDMASDTWKDFHMKDKDDELIDTDLTVFTARQATSLYSRSTDNFGPVGPSITTKDEVGDPYNLLIYNRLSGILRERSYTNAMVNGIEQTIHFLSQMFTLLPGSIIHMGTMSFDGYTVEEDMLLTHEDYMEIEIEKVGVLRNPVNDLRQKEEEIWQ
jgi:2-keto-4-pentenoate hydratase/2-oxohepta-3-ene-1,7-dioic acid hydratase in catechol pathway